MAKAETCNWQAGGQSCQFEVMNWTPVKAADGLHYCPLHCPIDDNARNGLNVSLLIRDAIDKRICCFDGVNFPHGETFRFKADKGTVSLKGCMFGKDARLEFHTLGTRVATTFQAPRGSGALIVRLPPGSFESSGIGFFGDVELIGTQTEFTNYDFSKCRFPGAVTFSSRLFGVWDFSQAEFRGPIRFPSGAFKGDLVSPRATVNFHRATFSRETHTDDSEGTFRALREAFAESSDRDNEALFYQQEKRSQRYQLNLGFTRGVSALYDLFSSYGRSYVKPLVIFWCLQIAAGMVYAWASANYKLALAWDGTIPAFTLAQAVRPFELVGLRTPSGLVESVVGQSPAPSWAIGTFAHGAISIIVFTLFVLALRWRFRRS
jgi:hypothetical protein